MSEYKYYKSDTNSVYREKYTTFSNGSPSHIVNRWNDDFKNWSGHIHDHEKTRERIKNLDGITEITESEVKKLTS